MGLKAGKTYSEKTVEKAIKSVLDVTTVKIEIKKQNAKLTIDGNAVKGKHGADGDNLRWSKMLNTNVPKAVGQEASASDFTSA